MLNVHRTPGLVRRWVQGCSHRAGTAGSSLEAAHERSEGRREGRRQAPLYHYAVNETAGVSVRDLYTSIITVSCQPSPSLQCFLPCAAVCVCVCVCGMCVCVCVCVCVLWCVCVLCGVVWCVCVCVLWCVCVFSVMWCACVCVCGGGGLRA